MRFRVYRYDPEQDAKPHLQEYDVELDRTTDAARRADTVEGSRRYAVVSAKLPEGVCGSDAMNINGKNGLACVTNLKELKEPVELWLLPGLPVIRDLIVDMSQFFKQHYSIKPYLVNDTPPPEKERLQSPEDREELDGLYECILAHAARPPVRRSGIPTSSSVPQDCCRLTASSPTATRRPTSGRQSRRSLSPLSLPRS
jgi:succinate dehydrogenase / fumarate reductase iron-sulfur subunit